MRDYIEDFLGLQKLTKRKEQELKEIKERKESAAKLLLEQMAVNGLESCLLYTSPSPRDRTRSRMPSSA